MSLKKRILIFALFYSLTALYLKSQPKWSVDPNQYQYSMTFTTVLLFDGKESKDTSDVIAAFVGDACRGIAKPIKPRGTGNQYVAFLMVFGNNIEGDTLSFKLYDQDQDQTVPLFNHVPFQSNASYGSPDNPLKNLVESKMTAYNFFSPNQDRRNETWVIEHPLYLDFEVSIYNNIGEQVYYKKNHYQNDWRGTYQGTDVPEGTYYYIVKSPDEAFVYQGTISLIR